MDWKTEAMMAAQAILAAFLGGLIGWLGRPHPHRRER